MDERFVRQESLGICRDQTVAIVGVGGIGSWVALSLNLAGVRELVLFDGDTVSASNLNRLPPGLRLGDSKSVGMAGLLQAAQSELQVHAYSNFEPGLHLEVLRHCQWVVVATDNLPSRRAVHTFCDEYGINYIECGAEGHRATVSFAPATWTTPDEENPGYRSVPVFIGPCLLAAAIVSYYVLLQEKPHGPETVAEWGDSGLTIYQHGGTHGTKEA